MKRLVLLVCSMFVLTVLAFANQPEYFKNPAGPANEMEAMRLPEVSTLGNRSKAAMLPIRFARDKNGNAVWQADVPVDSTDDLKFTLLAPNSEDWQIRVNDGEKTMNLRGDAVFVDRSFGSVGLDGVQFPAEVFGFDSANSGTWRVEITTRDTWLRDNQTAGYLVVSSKSRYQIYSYLDSYQTLTNRQIGFKVSVFENTPENQARVPETIGGTIQKAEAEVREPNGIRQKVIFGDADGNGIFDGSFVPNSAGQHTVQITVKGITPEGTRFIRTSEQVFQVLNDNVRIGNSAKTTVLDENRLQINLDSIGLRANRKVIVYGEIWAQNEAGEDVPVAWLNNMAIAAGARNKTFVTMILDSRWLVMANAKNSFELRSVRLQDADNFVTLATADRVSLNVKSLPEAANSVVIEINDEMRMGKRPRLTVSDAVGGKLMLVHGYCSGGNTFPTSQFTNYVVFSDPNQNRTHDQFANLIKNFGASLPSFGVVAHSQGGAASLHLYTYYWSGLDYATGSRLIQSVGTPYQGTALAGNLALLGQIFGAGCGSNSNLTYSGAASWLAGIPTWARVKVHYSTTSFTDVWWRYDYCNLATDPFLSDPEDGVVERAYAQLSGANNRGHKTGWCHTGGMRDPAQTSDSTRNADMNANAAR